MKAYEHCVALVLNRHDKFPLDSSENWLWLLRRKSFEEELDFEMGLVLNLN